MRSSAAPAERAKRFRMPEKLPGDSTATMRGQHYHVGHQRVGAGRIIELCERLSCQHGEKAYDGLVLLCNEHPAVRVGTSRLDLRPVFIGHRVTRAEPRV